MTEFKIAHIKEQDQEVTIIPVDPAFGRESRGEQQEIMDAPRFAARSEDLVGTVVVIWPMADASASSGLPQAPISSVGRHLQSGDEEHRPRIDYSRLTIWPTCKHDTHSVNV